MIVVLLLPLSGCRTATRKEPSNKVRGEFEQLRGPELARAAQMYREGRKEEGAELLRRLVSAPDWNIRSNAVRTIGEVRDSSLLPELLAALEDERLEVRESASRVLQWMGDQTSIRALHLALSDPEPIVRSNVAEALARIEGDSAGATLEELLKADSDPGVRAIAASTLSRVQGPSVIPALITALTDHAAVVRVRAAIALGEIGEASARPALEKASKDPDPQVRASAQAALKRLDRGTQERR